MPVRPGLVLWGEWGGLGRFRRGLLVGIDLRGTARHGLVAKDAGDEASAGGLASESHGAVGMLLDDVSFERRAVVHGPGE